MVNYGDLQFAKRIMVARRSEMSAEWKVRFAICIASVAIQAFTKLFKVTIIDHNPKWDDKSRQERESFWIRKLKTLSPNGINEKK
jgi:hypothetical protein